MRIVHRNLVTMILTLGVATLPLAASAQEPGSRPPRRPGGPPGGPGGGWRMFSSSLLPKSDREKSILAVLEDMDRNQRRGSMSVPMDDGRILRVLAEATGARNIVEIGTSIGYSAIWFCLGLEATGGKLTTFEIDEGRAAKARENFKRAGVEKMVTLVMGDAHEEVKRLKDPIDILFLDADKEGYTDYLEKLLPRVKAGGLVVAHNMTSGLADPRYFKAITSNPALETLFLNLDRSGIGITMKKH